MSVSFRVEPVHAKLFIIIFHHGELSRFEAEKEKKTRQNESYDEQKK